MISAIPHLLHPSEPVGVFSLLAQVRLAGGNCVLDLEDTRFSKRGGDERKTRLDVSYRRCSQRSA